MSVLADYGLCLTATVHGETVPIRSDDHPIGRVSGQPPHRATDNGGDALTGLWWNGDEEAVYLATLDAAHLLCDDHEMWATPIAWHDRAHETDGVADRRLVIEMVESPYLGYEVGVTHCARISETFHDLESMVCVVTQIDT